MNRLLGLAAATAMAAGSLVAASTSADASSPSFVDGIIRTIGKPNISPPGANKWDCRPSAAHPRPVVLVHGTGGNMSDNMGYLSSSLKRAGYCVFALNYGGPPAFGYAYGLGPIRRVGRATRCVRRPGARRHRRATSRLRGPQPRRDDAALVHEVPRWRGQDPRPHRPVAEQPWQRLQRDGRVPAEQPV